MEHKDLILTVQLGSTQFMSYSNLHAAAPRARDQSDIQSRKTCAYLDPPAAPIHELRMYIVLPLN